MIKYSSGVITWHRFANTISQYYALFANMNTKSKSSKLIQGLHNHLPNLVLVVFPVETKRMAMIVSTYASQCNALVFVTASDASALVKCKLNTWRFSVGNFVG